MERPDSITPGLRRWSDELFVNSQKVVGVAGVVEHVSVPIIGALIPGAAPILGAIDSIFQRVLGTIVTVEMQSPAGGGPDKMAASVGAFNDGLEMTQSILALEKKRLTYDQAKLQEAITAQVAAFNAFAQVKASFKVESLP
jgi:hypothetical protein